MSEIQKRLQESSEACFKSYQEWDTKKSDVNLRETLQETIHELRKAVSRLEIEIAISERDNMSSKPLPIPPHRSSSKAKGVVESILPDEGNTVEKKRSSAPKGGRRPRARRPMPKNSN